MSTITDIENRVEMKLLSDPGTEIVSAIQVHEAVQEQPEIVSAELFSNGNVIVHYAQAGVQRFFSTPKEAVDAMTGTIGMVE